MMPRRSRDREPAGHEPRAAQKALVLLEAVAQLGPGVTAREISVLTGIPPTTAYRLLNVLVGDGFLVRVADLSGFALGRRTRELADAVVETAPAAVVAVSAAAIEELRSRVRHAIVVASYDGGRIRLVDRDPDHELSREHAIRTHLHASAIGKILLAHGTGADGGPLHPLTARTITDPVVLAGELHAVRVTGVAREVDEVKLGRSALAVPVWAAGRVVGCVCAIGRTGRIDLDDAALVETLRSCTDPVAVIPARA